jgi:hypothetical protein
MATVGLDLVEVLGGLPQWGHGYQAVKGLQELQGCAASRRRAG